MIFFGLKSGNQNSLLLYSDKSIHKKMMGSCINCYTCTEVKEMLCFLIFQSSDFVENMEGGWGFLLFLV